MLRNLLWLALVSFTLIFWTAGSAYAQSANEYVTSGNVPEWVVPQSPVYSSDSNSEILDTTYNLIDRQRYYTTNSTTRYYRYVETLNTAAGVEENSTISISFDPSYQRVVFHDVSVIRDGIRIDKLDLNEFDLYRVETDRDRLLYNSDLQTSFIVPDVRIGDTIDYSYTLSGRNPAVGNNFFSYVQLQFGVPVNKLHIRYIDADRQIKSTKAHAGAAEPVVQNYGTGQVLTWSSENVGSIDTDSDTPTWFYSYPAYELSTSGSWADVGKYFAPYYQPPETLPPALVDVLAEITQTYQTDEERARAALDYIQREIRYLGIEIGTGGYIPRSPQTVLERRFGDCKDVTVLLVTMLRAMDLEAEPLLVSTSRVRGVTETIPSYAAFNHVITRVVINGQDYFLDATRSQQIGSLDTLEQSHYGQGLPISETSAGLIPFEPVVHEWRKDIVDTYDLISDPDNIFFTSRLTYFGEEADSNISWLQSDGKDAVEKSFLEYFQDFLPTLVTKDPMTVDIDEDAASISFNVSYIIKDAWEEDEDREDVTLFYSFPYEIAADFPSYTGTPRTSPAYIAHPYRTRQTVIMMMNPDWSMTPEAFSLSNDSFDYSKTATFEDYVYTEVYEYRTKQNFITSEEYAAVMKEVETVRDDMGITLQQDLSPGLSDMSFIEAYYYFGATWMFVAIVIAIIFAVIYSKRDIEIRKEALYYPVSLHKFLILSILTMGYYQIYWIYKCWLWRKTVSKENLSPLICTWFSGFTNFSLFPHIAGASDEGFKWFRLAAIPLAILSLLAPISTSIIVYMDTVPAWVSALSYSYIILLIPVAMQVQKINRQNPDVVAYYSKMDWRAVGLMLLFLPILFWPAAEVYFSAKGM